MARMIGMIILYINTQHCSQAFERPATIIPAMEATAIYIVCSKGFFEIHAVPQTTNKEVKPSSHSDEKIENRHVKYKRRLKEGA